MHAASQAPLMEYIKIHLQAVFRYYVAKMQRLYINNGLMNPNMLSIQDLVQWIQHLSRNLTYCCF